MFKGVKFLDAGRTALKFFPAACRLLVVLMAVTHAAGVRAGEWPQYRGPNHDGSSPETIRTDWKEKPPRVVWRKAFDPGFSSITTEGGRLFTMGRRTTGGVERECAICLDAASGDEVWAADLDLARYTDLSGYDDRMDGPRSTPSVQDGRVYVFTSQLKLYALRADTGVEIWHRDFVAEFGSDVIAWENTASPLVVGGLVFLNSNAPGKRLMALRTSDGTTAWSAANDGLTHASAVFARIHDRPQVIFLTRAGLVSMVPETGGELWRLAFAPSGTSTASSPVVVGEYVHASAAYASGTWIARISSSANGLSASQVSRQRGTAFQIHWSTPVAHEGFLYAVPSPSSSQGRLVCLDVAAGVNRWERAQVGSGDIGYGSLIKAANSLIVLTEGGELVLVEPNPAAYNEKGRLKVLENYCWNHPTLAKGRIYARSTSPLQPELTAIDVEPAFAPYSPVKLAAEWLPDLRRLRIVLRLESGDPLDVADVTRWELLATTDPSAPPSQWAPLPAAFSAANGGLTAEISEANEKGFFLIARAKAGGN